ncbi:MAG TPA: cytochrome c oxidase assembly protein [Phycisphaerales bacterium]|nr:cytochrome c oxidase assembly protein [Phycisphaerales bacterium]HMP36635.1 cytochrome c oxidase assembly protein [Phycisphaerales bacterium]
MNQPFDALQSLLAAPELWRPGALAWIAAGWVTALAAIAVHRRWGSRAPSIGREGWTAAASSPNASKTGAGTREDGAAGPSGPASSPARSRLRCCRAVVAATAVAGLLALGFVSPVGPLAEGVLFSAHMLQHLILLLAIPLVLWTLIGAVVHAHDPGSPRGGIGSTAGRTTRFEAGSGTGCAPGCATARRDDARAGPARPGALRRTLALPLVGGVLGVGAMWFWHDPAACNAALRHGAVAALRDLSLVLAGLAFWYPVLVRDARLRLAPPMAVAYLMVACAGCTALGIAITFASGAVCPAFGIAPTPAALEPLRAAGFSRSVDQQLGGLLMWVPPCLLYASVSLLLLRRWYAAHGDARPAAADGAAQTAGAFGRSSGAAASAFGIASSEIIR